MKYGRALPLLLCPLLAAVVVGWWRWPRPSHVNVVLVVIDTLRSDHLATYGYARQTAPFLDRLAQEGAVFDGLSPSSWTKPATASLLTGLHPLHHQAIGRLDELPDQVVTLAERLRAKEYRTLAVSANGWISSPFGFDQGFDELILEDSVGYAEDVNQALLPRLDDLAPPFFLYLHYIDPHAPYAPRGAWNGSALPNREPVAMESLDPFTVRQRPAELLARVRDLYDGEIRGADRGLEQLVRELERRKLMRNTILVVTSDHGEEIEDHGRMSHGLSLYEEVVRVPLIVHAPGRVPASRHGLASLLDVVPTLAELLDLPEEGASLDGTSLAGRLRGEDAASGPRRHLLHLDHIDGTGLALSDGREKILLGQGPYAKALFDLRTDPGERRNLLGQEDDEGFVRLVGELAARYNDLSRRALPREQASLTAELSGRLAALGYAVLPSRADDLRRIPRRIVPADAAASGLLGWEGELASCFELSEPEADRQLLRGWHDREEAGRWSTQQGTLVLGPPAGGGRSTLVLGGVSHRLDTPRVTVRAAQRQLIETPVPPGAFRLTAEVDVLPGSGPLLVEIATDRAFVPSEHGMADSRPLGLFFFSACLQTAGAAAAASPAAHATR